MSVTLASVRHRVTARERKMMRCVMVAFSHQPRETETADLRDHLCIRWILRGERDLRTVWYLTCRCPIFSSLIEHA